jgi:hypothetical protein
MHGGEIHLCGEWNAAGCNKEHTVDLIERYPKSTLLQERHELVNVYTSEYILKCWVNLN